MPYQQKNGKWRASKMIHGVRKQKIFSTKKKALKWESGQNLEKWMAPETPTVFYLSTEYLNYCKKRFVKKTYQEKQVALKNLFKYVSPNCPGNSIPTKAIHSALMARSKISGNTANKDRKNLIAFYQWCIKVHDLPDNNPFKKIQRFNYDSMPRYVPPEKDFWSAFHQAGPEDQTFLLTALHTAARRGELFRLKWSDVDFQNSTIRLGTKKTRDGSMEYVTLPMTSILKETLLKHKENRLRSLFVFSRTDGQPFTSRQHYMKGLCKRAKVPHFGFHSIRHLSASILARSGVPLPTIQAILRHKSSTTTAKYLHSLGVVEDLLEGVFSEGKKEQKEG